jgi:hypothetical protein
MVKDCPFETHQCEDERQGRDTIMRQNADGTFEADPGEKITFTVRRTAPPCVAGFAPDGWKASGPVNEPDGATEVKTCTAPTTEGARCTMSISVSFTPDVKDAADKYAVSIEGSGGGDQPSPDTFSPPPAINGEVFKFHVSKP